MSAQHSMDGGVGLHESLLEISPIGMAIIAASGQILYSNPAFGEVLDSAPANLLHKQLSDVAPAPARNYVSDRISCAAKMGDARCKWAIEPGQPWIELYIERALDHCADFLLVRASRGVPFAASQSSAPSVEPQTRVAEYAVVASEDDPVGEVSLIDMTALAAEVADDLRRRTGSNPAIKIQPGMVVRSDPALVRLVLQHLIDNAIKFVVHGETARVEIGQSDGVFFVRDGGIGFEPSQAATIFKPFERLSEAEGYPGAGVGLASVKRIVERLGGMVWAISKPNRGATFFVRL